MIPLPKIEAALRAQKSETFNIGELRAIHCALTADVRDTFLQYCLDRRDSARAGWPEQFWHRLAGTIRKALTM